MPYKDPVKQREYQRKWMARRRAKYLEKMGSCSVCGSTQFPMLHHRDPEQKVSHRIWSWSRERLEAELAKCTIMCAKCHCYHHTGKGPIKHGTLSAYNHLRCRCDPCREASRRYSRRYYARRKAARIQQMESTT